MQAYKLKPSAGFRWIVEAFSLIKKKPLFMIFLTMSILVLSGLVIGLLSQISVALPYVLMPVFSMLFFRACHLVDHKLDISFAALTQSINKQKIIRSLQLGVIWGVIIFLLSLITIIEPSTMQKMQSLLNSTNGIESTAELNQSQLQEQLFAIVNEVNFIKLAVFFFLLFVVNFVITLSALLVLKHENQVLQSIVFAFIGLSRNILPFIIYTISVVLFFYAISLIITLLSALLGMGALVSIIYMIGMLVMSAVIWSSVYTCYKSIYRSMPASNTSPTQL